jgi:hypothetical protein
MQCAGRTNVPTTGKTDIHRIIALLKARHPKKMEKVVGILSRA